jgi:glycosyltransferase involved in cell wall biosynthesis
VVLSVSRLSAEKDLPMLLRAFARLHRERPQARLLLAGDGPEHAALQAHIQRLGLGDVAALAGRVQGPQTWMRRAAVLALASQYEGFGNVLVEALAQGCAVVATDCPVGPREILQDGRWGALVPLGDDAAMAHALRAAVDVPGAPAGAVAHAQQFTDSACCTAYRRLLDGLGRDRLAGADTGAVPC